MTFRHSSGRLRSRLASTYSAFVMFLASAAILALLVGLLLWPSGESDDGQPQTLFVYYAAGLRVPMEAVVRDYEQAYGVSIQLQAAGSNTLLGNIQVAQRGDLFVPADDYYVHLAQKKNLIDEVIPLAEITPVIAVRKGNPKGIHSLEQLCSGQYRLVLADPDTAAIGHATREALPVQQWEQLKKAARNTTTVIEVANAIKVGSADAGIVWDGTISQYPDLEMVISPELSKKKAKVSVTVLKYCTQPAAALAFARYLAASDKGLLQFKKAGYTPLEGDVWAAKPDIKLFAGAMLQPAIKQTIKDFEKREGVTVTTGYNGCGILVAQMKAGAKPDAYFACEKSFMTQVHDLFLEPVDISSNNLVVVVQKGNPKDIKTFADLGKPGVRVGVGHEQQCALGAITQEALKATGNQAQVMKNVKVRVPTGDMLINELKTGSLDAVIAYVSNAAGLDYVEAYRVENCPNAVAVQPMAIGKESQFKQLSGRLMSAIRSAQSRERFLEYGFRWQDNPP